MKINSPLGSSSFPNFTNGQSRENREERRGDPRGGARLATRSIRIPNRRRSVSSLSVCGIVKGPDTFGEKIVVVGPVGIRPGPVSIGVGIYPVVRSAVEVGMRIVVNIHHHRTPPTLVVHQRITPREHRVQPPFRLHHRTLYTKHDVNLIAHTRVKNKLTFARSSLHPIDVFASAFSPSFPESFPEVVQNSTGAFGPHRFRPSFPGSPPRVVDNESKSTSVRLEGKSSPESNGSVAKFRSDVCKQNTPSVTWLIRT